MLGIQILPGGFRVLEDLTDHQQLAVVGAYSDGSRVDLTGKFVMPGIINLHGHLGNTKGLVADPKNFTLENLNNQLGTYAKFGVTSVVSMGSEQAMIFSSCVRAEVSRMTFTPAGCEALTTLQMSSNTVS